MNRKVNDSIENEDSQRQSRISQVKPWTVEKEKERTEKIDRLATKILTDEAMKIIEEAYDGVFQSENMEKEEENLQNP